MTTTAELARQLRENRDDIVQATLAEWNAIGNREPWLALPPKLDQNHLPGLLDKLVDATLSEAYEHAARRAFVRAAAQHGEDRLRDGFDEKLLFTEYHLLRHSISSYLRCCGFERRVVLDALIRIDTALTIATSASLRGMHRDAFEAAGSWESSLDALIAEWPSLTDPTDLPELPPKLGAA
jgi:hypothetical protein